MDANTIGAYVATLSIMAHTVAPRTACVSFIVFVDVQQREGNRGDLLSEDILNKIGT